MVRNMMTMACLLALGGLVAAASEVRAQSKPYVDLELVLAVDVSLSMDHEEQRLQRDGYVAAFRDPKLMKAIRSGPNGKIAVTYVEWAGAGIQSVVLPWRVVATPSDAQAFADALAEKPIRRARMTSISGVVLLAQELFSESPVRGLRRVIDVSGDGPNNSGSRVDHARDRLVAAGVVVNGLAIRIKSGGGAYSYFDLPDLDAYFKDCVIGGPGSFVLSITKKSEFATAIRQKLLLEIADRTPQPRPWVHRTGFETVAEKYDCLIGERQWQRYLNERDDW